MAIAATAVLPATDNVRNWLESLRPARYGAVRAWLNESWRLLDGWPQPSEWSGAETSLVLSLFRPRVIELCAFVEEHALELEDETMFDGSTAVWSSYLRGRTRRPDDLVRPRELFSVTMAVDNYCASSVWTWTAIALTQRLALLCERSDDYGLALFPTVLGVIDRKNPYQSAALLLHHQDGNDAARFEHAGNFFDELDAWHIPSCEVYRLLLARSGLGGSGVLTQDAARLKRFKAQGMHVGFDDVSELLRGVNR